MPADRMIPRDLAADLWDFHGTGEPSFACGVGSTYTQRDASGGATTLWQYSSAGWRRVPVVLDDLQDVAVAGASAGAYLRFNGSVWYPYNP